MRRAKELRLAEMDASKAKNVMEHEDEIHSRPARTWCVCVSKCACLGEGGRRCGLLFCTCGECCHTAVLVRRFQTAAQKASMKRAALEAFKKEHGWVSLPPPTALSVCCACVTVREWVWWWLAQH